jgi:hypothetical protein
MPTLPPLHVVLPQLEQAAKQRTEAAILLDLSPAELRGLLYEVIRTHEIELADPSLYLARLGDKARADADTLNEARCDSLEVRTAILDCLLETLRSSIGSLLGPVVIDAWQRPSHSNLDEQIDPHLRGFELVDGLKRGQVGKNRFERSGESLWIVALAPVESVIDHDYDPRYAILEHHGEETPTESGTETHSWNLVNLVTAEIAAEKIRDDKLEAMIESVIRRLRSAASGKQDDLASRIERAVRRLEHGLRALREYDDDA